MVATEIYLSTSVQRGNLQSHTRPIFDLAPARPWDVSDCHQLLDNLAAELDLTRSKDNQGAVSDRIIALTKAATVE